MEMQCKYTNYDLPNLVTTIRKKMFGFIQISSVCQNSIVRVIKQPWLVRIVIVRLPDQSSLPRNVSS